MDKPVKVDLPELHAAVKKVGVHTEEVNAVHTTAINQAEGSHGGWVGKSAEALGTMVTHWRASTEHHVTQLDRLGVHVHHVGAALNTTDINNEVDIKEVGDDLERRL